jgi:hypothetical protein
MTLARDDEVERTEDLSLAAFRIPIADCVRSYGERPIRPYADTRSGSRGLDGSGSFFSFGQRDLLAAFKEEPHKRQQ